MPEPVRCVGSRSPTHPPARPPTHLGKARRQLIHVGPGRPPPQRQAQVGAAGADAQVGAAGQGGRQQAQRPLAAQPQRLQLAAVGQVEVHRGEGGGRGGPLHMVGGWEAVEGLSAWRSVLARIGGNRRAQGMREGTAHPDNGRGRLPTHPPPPHAPPCPLGAHRYV